MERKYMMYEGEDVNTIDLLYETPTDQSNGVKVIVPVRYGDRWNFIAKIKDQLAYFESVYFDVDGIDNDNVVIVRHDFFQFSSLSSDRNMHICLDNVYYPMDFVKLGIDFIDIPVALRFSLTDGIFPTPNREAIRYTQEAKTVIINRLKQAADYFVEKYNETVEETTDLKKIIDHYGSRDRYVKIGEADWDIHPLFKYASVQPANPTLKGINHLDVLQLVRLQDYILGEYEAKFFVNSKSVRDAKRYYQPTAIKRLPERVYVYYGDRIPGVKKDYIKSLQPNSHEEALIVRKVKDFPLYSKFKHNGDYDNYYTMLQLKNHPKSEWREIIKEFQSIVKSYVDTFINIDTLEVPEDFIDSRKKKRVSSGIIKDVTVPRKVKLKGEMVCKQAYPLERWVDGKNCKWVSETYDMATFHKNPFILVYGRQEDATSMDKWFKSIDRMNIKLAVLSERELKVVEKIDLHNLISFSKFMEGKNKPFQRIATACLIDKFYDEQTSLFNNSEPLKSVSSDLQGKISAMRNYKSKWYRRVDDSVRDAIIQQAEETNSFDPTIYSDCKAVISICQKFPFINTLIDKMPYYDSEVKGIMTQALIDLLKYHKHRIDWKNYNIRLNEDLPLEQTLTTETVEELTNQD